MFTELPIILSTTAIVISLLTFGLIYFWGGRLKFTKPSQIQFFYIDDKQEVPATYVRLYTHSSGLAGKLIENLYLEIKKDETSKNFGSWMANTGSGYRALSGLKVMRDGVSLDNVFQSPQDKTAFFQAGNYQLNLFCREANKSHSKSIWLGKFSLVKDQVQSLNSGKIIIFTISTDGSSYIASTQDKTEDRDSRIINQFVDKFSEKIVGET